MRLRIGTTSKLDGIPTTGFLRELTCERSAPCYTKGCYASGLMYRRNLWETLRENTLLWRTDPQDYEKQFREYLEAHRPSYFRLLTFGDFPDQEYVDMLKRVAVDFRSTHFLANTKKYNFDYTKMPDNLTIILSEWGSYKPSEKISLPRAIVLFDLAQPLPAGRKYFACPEKCTGCFHCFGLRPDEAVVLPYRQKKRLLELFTHKKVEFVLDEKNFAYYCREKLTNSGEKGNMERRAAK